MLAVFRELKRSAGFTLIGRSLVTAVISILVVLASCEVRATAQDGTDEAQLIQKIELLGGCVMYDEGSPERPVIGIKFSSNARFNDKFVYLLKSFPRLKRLDLLHATMTDAGVKEIGQFTGLSELKLSGPDITDASVNEFGNLKNLRKLMLCATQVTVDGKAKLSASIPSLTIQDESEVIRNMAANYGAMFSDGTVRGNVNRILRFSDPSHVLLEGGDNIGFARKGDSGNAITDEGMRNLRPLRGLRSLTAVHFSSCHKVTDDGIKELVQFNFIVNLSIVDCPHVTGKGLSAFKSHPNLRTLNLDQGDVIADNDLRHVAELKNLMGLSVRGQHVTDDGIQELTKLRNLTHLTLSETKISGAGFRALQELRNLKYLYLLKCPGITDEVMEELDDLPSLRFLSLGEAKITNVGLKHMGNLVNLQILKILDCEQITDEGIKHLAQMANLQRLSVQGCRVTQQGIEELQKQLPSLRITR